MRPETASRLFQLRDECRRVAYLESRRHVLENHHELALPAAERSLHFAREVHGQNSIDLVPPLLALADVATLAGAKESKDYVSRAAFLIQEKTSELKIQLQKPLGQKILQNLQAINSVNKKYIPEFLKNNQHSQSQSPQRSPQKMAKSTSPGQKSLQNSTNMAQSQQVQGPQQFQTTKLPIQLCQESMIDNAQREEMYNTKQGLQLAHLQSKYWASKTKIQIWEQQYSEALDSASVSLYFATLSCGIQSLQSSLAIYQLAELGRLSGRFSDQQQVNSFLEAQKIFVNVLLKFYSILVIQVNQMVQDRKLIFNYASDQLQQICQDYNKSESMNEEDRLGFRADVKEGVQFALIAMKVIENQFGMGSIQYCQCVILIGLALQCTEDVDAGRWDSEQGKSACTKVMKMIEANQHNGGEYGAYVVHLYRMLYGW